MDVTQGLEHLVEATAAFQLATAEIAKAREEIGTARAREQGFNIGDKVTFRGFEYELTKFGGGTSFHVDIRGVRLKKNGKRRSNADQWLSFGFSEIAHHVSG